MSSFTVLASIEEEFIRSVGNYCIENEVIAVLATIEDEVIAVLATIEDEVIAVLATIEDEVIAVLATISDGHLRQF